MEITQINYGYLTAYMINNTVFQLDGKIFKSIRAFKNYVGKSKDLPKINKNEIFNISGSTQQIENVYNNLIKGQKMTEKEYYKKEFDKLGDLTKVSFKFTGWTDSTKEMNLNLDSIEELEKLIKKAKKQLKK